MWFGFLQKLTLKTKTCVQVYLRGDLGGGNEGAGRMRLQRRKRRNIRVMFLDCHCGQQGLILLKLPKKHTECLQELSTQWLGGKSIHPLAPARWSRLPPAPSPHVCKTQDSHEAESKDIQCGLQVGCYKMKKI